MIHKVAEEAFFILLLLCHFPSEHLLPICNFPFTRPNITVSKKLWKNIFFGENSFHKLTVKYMFFYWCHPLALNFKLKEKKVAVGTSFLRPCEKWRHCVRKWSICSTSSSFIFDKWFGTVKKRKKQTHCQTGMTKNGKFEEQEWNIGLIYFGNGN